MSAFLLVVVAMAIAAAGLWEALLVHEANRQLRIGWRSYIPALAWASGTLAIAGFMAYYGLAELIRVRGGM